MVEVVTAMKIETITMVYNEAFLLPFYLRHYAWADRINILFDTDTSDGSMAILKAFGKETGKVNILPFSFPDGLDDLLKAGHFNAAYRSMNCDMVVLSDCDEFLLADRHTIEGLPDEDVFISDSGFVYRHITEEDLNNTLSIKEQRRHGLIYYGGAKPMVARTNRGVEWEPGNHSCNKTPVDCGLVFAHWSMADPCFCVERRVKNRRDRMSKVNIRYRLGRHLQGITENDVIQECKEHEHDERIW